MALSASGLKSAMLDALDLPQEIDAETRAHIEERVEKFADAIIDYITSNAEVTTTVTGVCPSGGGPLTGGAGTGTIS